MLPWVEPVADGILSRLLEEACFGAFVAPIRDLVIGYARHTMMWSNPLAKDPRITTVYPLNQWVILQTLPRLALAPRQWAIRLDVIPNGTNGTKATTGKLEQILRQREWEAMQEYYYQELKEETRYVGWKDDVELSVDEQATTGGFYDSVVLDFLATPLYRFCDCKCEEPEGLLGVELNVQVAFPSGLSRSRRIIYKFTPSNRREAADPQFALAVWNTTQAIRLTLLDHPPTTPTTKKI